MSDVGQIRATRDDLERLALTAADVARLLDISQRHVWALDSSGRLPRLIRLGRSVRWNAAELRDWLRAGLIRYLSCGDDLCDSHLVPHFV